MNCGVESRSYPVTTSGTAGVERIRQLQLGSESLVDTIRYSLRLMGTQHWSLDESGGPSAYSLAQRLSYRTF